MKTLMSDKSAKLIEKFRVASRELFNHYFSIDDAWERQGEAWLMVERFGDVETLLFRKMVSEALDLSISEYGNIQKNILVQSKDGNSLEGLLNREVSTGYWDYPITNIPSDAEMYFIAFFDWDTLSLRDNEYVRVMVATCASTPEIAGKHALIGAREVTYSIRYPKAAR